MNKRCKGFTEKGVIDCDRTMTIEYFLRKISSYFKVFTKSHHWLVTIDDPLWTCHRSLASFSQSMNNLNFPACKYTSRCWWGTAGRKPSGWTGQISAKGFSTPRQGSPSAPPSSTSPPAWWTSGPSRHRSALATQRQQYVRCENHFCLPIIFFVDNSYWTSLNQNKKRRNKSLQIF